jgi:hypothetical protein
MRRSDAQIWLPLSGKVTAKLPFAPDTRGWLRHCRCGRRNGTRRISGGCCPVTALPAFGGGYHAHRAVGARTARQVHARRGHVEPPVFETALAVTHTAPSTESPTGLQISPVVDHDGRDLAIDFVGAGMWEDCCSAPRSQNPPGWLRSSTIRPRSSATARRRPAPTRHGAHRDGLAGDRRGCRRVRRGDLVGAPPNVWCGLCRTLWGRWPGRGS